MPDQDESRLYEATVEPVVTPRRSKRTWSVLGTLLVGILAVWGMNYFLVGQPVTTKLSADPRNNGLDLSAHYQYYLDPSTLVIDLQKASGASPADIFRALLQTAEVLHEGNRYFTQVILARSGKPVFMMKGDEFAALGSELAGGQNPVFLLRTLPEKLLLPSGEAAYGHWEGGWLGVLGKQMEDMNLAARKWAEGG